jgi:MEMO1 family protein
MDVRSLFNLSEEMVEAAGECGLRPIFFLDGRAWTDWKRRPNCCLMKARLGSAMRWRPLRSKRRAEGGVDVKQDSLPVRIAKASLNYLMEHGKILPAFSEPVAARIAEPAGVFVSLKKQGQLRGCIGTILPTQSPMRQAEIIRNAVSAATADPRFPRVQPHELAELKISVDILTHAGTD